MKYKILKNKEVSLGRYKIVTIREEDIFCIMRWRNDQIDILRQKKQLTKKDQQKYFDEVVQPTFIQSEPPIMLFSLLLDDILIGYGGLVYIDWQSQRAEVSFLVDTRRAEDEAIYESDFSAYLDLIKKVAFDSIDLNRIYTETFSVRPKHIKILEKNGFKYEGTMKQHVRINGEYVDSVIHGILGKDYNKS